MNSTKWSSQIPQGSTGSNFQSTFKLMEPKEDAKTRRENRRRQKFELRRTNGNDDEDDTECSLDPMEAIADSQSREKSHIMNNLHSSYGSLSNVNNSSLNNASLSGFQSCNQGLNLSDSEFHTPIPSSPFKVQLRKTEPKTSLRSPTPSRLHNYNLMEDFSTPKQWHSPINNEQRLVQEKKSSLWDAFPVSNEDVSEVEETEVTRLVVGLKKEKVKSGTVDKNSQMKKAKELARKSTIKTETTPQEIRRKQVGLKEQQQFAQERRKGREHYARLIAERAVEEAIRQQFEEKRTRRQREKDAIQAEQEDLQRLRKDAIVREQQHAQIRHLKQQLSSIKETTEGELAEIRLKTANKKENIRQRAYERHNKRLHQPNKGDELIHETHDIVEHLRRENAVIRERNEKLFKDIQNLRINNQRLESSNCESSVCLQRVQFHEEICATENVKLKNIESKYKNAVEEHEDHLALHQQYGEMEHRMCMAYDKLLSSILNIINQECREKDLVQEINGKADFLRKGDSRQVLLKEFNL